MAEKKTDTKPDFRVDEIETEAISDRELDDVSGGSCAGCDRCGACHVPPDQSGGG